MLGAAAERAVNLHASQMPRLFYFRKQPIGHLWRVVPSFVIFDSTLYSTLRCQYDEQTQSEKKRFGSKTYFFSAVVIDAYESIFDEEKPAALSPFTELNWLTKSEVCSIVHPTVGSYMRSLLP